MNCDHPSCSHADTDHVLLSGFPPDYKQSRSHCRHRPCGRFRIRVDTSWDSICHSCQPRIHFDSEHQTEAWGWNDGLLKAIPP
jgi:hypothetical protein